jgi:phosphoribosylanthranilate isomerase
MLSRKRRKPKIKICCIQSVEESLLAIRWGASAVGLVSAMPSGPGSIPLENIAAIAATVPPGVDSALLTCSQNFEEVVAQQRQTCVTAIQFVDTFPVHDYALLRKALPGIRLIQVIHVRGNNSPEEAVQTAPHVNALLLDSGNPLLKVKELGGTGRTHDWSLSRQIVDGVSVPVFLAGGLNPSNIRTAIETVQPYGVDVCSGVRTNGVLDEEKLAAFISQIEEVTYER